jgi:protein gp37
LGAGTAKREGERVRGGKGVPVAFHPPDIIACFMPQRPPGNRHDLWSLIRSTPALDWFLLTKRPRNIGDMLPTDWGEGWPHVWLGTTTETQEEANCRIPHLVAIPAAVRFLSVEPMVEPVDLARWWAPPL